MSSAASLAAMSRRAQALPFPSSDDDVTGWPICDRTITKATILDNLVSRICHIHGEFGQSLIRINRNVINTDCSACIGSSIGIAKDFNEVLPMLG